MHNISVINLSVNCYFKHISHHAPPGVDICRITGYNFTMIKLENIDLELGGKQVFKKFNFYAEKGMKVLLDAPSGTGKSCFFNIIMGFMRPTAGSVRIGGRELSGVNVCEVRKRICYIAQESRLTGASVRDVLCEIGSYKANKGLDFGEARIRELLHEFSLEEGTLERSIEALSGGERQRLSFVICLLLNRDIWLLDEITAGLDKHRKRVVMESVSASDKTVIVASHDPGWREYGLREAAWQGAGERFWER